jgi:hypothetical protein
VNAASTSTIPQTSPSLGRRRLGYAITSAALALLMAAAAVDAVDGVAILGVDSDEVQAAGGGFHLEVTYGVVSRPALATPFDIEVRHAGGFAAPIRVAVDHEYLRMWDENGLSPAPSSETVMGPWVVWEFEPPVGDTLRVTFDARIEPAAQEGRSGHVAVLGADDQALVDVSFTTRVLP